MRAKFPRCVSLLRLGAITPRSFIAVSTGSGRLRSTGIRDSLEPHLMQEIPLSRLWRAGASVRQEEEGASTFALMTAGLEVESHPGTLIQLIELLGSQGSEQRALTISAGLSHSLDECVHLPAGLLSA